MNILILGVSNVGKTTIGNLLANQLGFDFYDLDEEIKKHFNITLEVFVHTGTLYERDQIRCEKIQSLLALPGDKVISVTPLSYLDSIRSVFSFPDVLAIELIDSVQNIFDRLVFSDENDIIYKDDEYKNAHKAYYLREINEDLKWYGHVYSGLTHRFNLSGLTPEESVKRLIKRYHLKKS